MKLFYHICTECGNTMAEDHRPDCMTCGFADAVCEDTKTRKIDDITEKEFVDGIAAGGLNMDPEDEYDEDYEAYIPGYDII